MSGSDRLDRINAALATGERKARQELARSNAELAAAEAGLQSVLEQCRLGASGPGSDLSIVAGLAVVQSGLAEAADREAGRQVASDDVDEKSEMWLKANSRHEAATRLLDRWQEEADAESDRRAEAELNDAITARRIANDNRVLHGHRGDDAHGVPTTRPAEDGLQ